MQIEMAVSKAVVGREAAVRLTCLATSSRHSSEVGAPHSRTDGPGSSGTVDEGNAFVNGCWKSDFRRVSTMKDASRILFRDSRSSHFVSSYDDSIRAVSMRASLEYSLRVERSCDLLARETVELRYILREYRERRTVGIYVRPGYEIETRPGTPREQLLA